jgi:uncharacterized protein (TIGR00297 family)
MSVYHYLPFLLVLMTIVIVSIKTEKLTLSGALTGGAIAIFIFMGAGYTGIFILAAFFILGTAATVWRRKEKQHFKAAGDHTKRNSGQVLANGGVAAMAGILAWFIPSQTELLRIMMAAGLASAMADTLSSELGMVYGRRFYNIITFKKDKPGLDGVISMEGTLLGLAGSAIIAVIYALGFGWDVRFLIILIAGTIGNLADSVLGALLERKHYLNNDAVNFLNTLIAALVAGWCVILS